jgi:hypothetical protein
MSLTAPRATAPAAGGGGVHPKADPPNISEAAVTKALNAIIELLNFVFTAVYKKKLPAYNRGLSSKLSV